MILVYVQMTNGKVHEASQAALGAAGKLGSPVHALVVGPADAGALKPLGAERVLAVEDERLDRWAPGAHARALRRAVEESGATVVLAGSTAQANEVFARAAAPGDWGVATGCVALEPDGDALKLTRAIWGGSLLQDARLAGTPKLVTVEPSAFPAQGGASGKASVEALSVPFEEADFADQLARVEPGEKEGIPLTQAKVVVGGGRGVGGEEGFDLLEALAELINGAVGGSRVATNNGWRPHSDQIGQTGTQIAPEVYIACGISGAIQHMVGCKNSKHIVAINKDADAPIFQRANYGILGDLHEVVPALIEEIKKLKA